MSFCVDFSFCTNCRLAFNRVFILNVVSYLIVSYSTFVSYFKYFVFNYFSYLNCFVLKCRVMLHIIFIKCCTSDVVPFLFIYVMCLVFLIDCFTFKHCLVSNFARVYFILYMSHLRKYLYLFRVLSFSLGQTRVPKCPNPYKPTCLFNLTSSHPFA